MKRGITLMVIGGILILTALGFILNYMYEEKIANREAEIICSKLIVQIEEEKVSNSTGTSEQLVSGEKAAGIPDESQTIRSKLTGANIDTIDIDGLDYIGYLSIPDLDLDLPVVSKWSYDALKVSPARFPLCLKVRSCILQTFTGSSIRLKLQNRKSLIRKILRK